MNDDKKKYNNTYEKLAAFLDEPKRSDEKEPFSSDEEARKLLYLWNECHPAGADAEKVWEKTLQRIGQAEQPQTGRRRRLVPVWGWAAAASVILLIGAALFWRTNTETGMDERTRMEQMMLAHADTSGVEEVTLVVSDEKKIELANNSKVAYDASGQVSVNSTRLSETVAQQQESQETAARESETVEYNQLIVPKGRRSMVVLADNSKMWVNSGSKVIYPRTFTGERREIFVEGEVYLQVTHDETRPFVVNTSALDVEVLGTSFNVSAYRGDAHASVVLVEGAVDVKDRADRHVWMQPNERVQLDDAGTLQKETVHALDYIHWVDGVWVLNGKPLKEVLDYLSEYYGKRIVCNPAVADELFYGKLFLNEELDKVLESIRRTLPEELQVSQETLGIAVE